MNFQVPEPSIPVLGYFPYATKFFFPWWSLVETTLFYFLSYYQLTTSGSADRVHFLSGRVACRTCIVKLNAMLDDAGSER